MTASGGVDDLVEERAGTREMRCWNPSLIFWRRLLVFFSLRKEMRELEKREIEGLHAFAPMQCDFVS
jgi:hypothetical protein